MRKIVIAFDVDGTLINNRHIHTYPDRPLEPIEPNERPCRMLMDLSHSKNTRIVVWSGQGEQYAKDIVRDLGLSKYVNGYASKNHLGKVDGKHRFDPDFVPDIAFDDIQACELGVANIIVREK